MIVFDRYGAAEHRESVVDENRPRVLDALSDFQFVGSVADGLSLNGQTIKPQDLPTTFEVGRQYIWLKRGHADNQEIFKTLQDRLRGNGITILDAKGITNRFIGGLAFRISFKEAHYKGTLFNTLDPRIVKSKKLQKHWGFDDYVLVFEKTP
jgi:hypothetical protein